MDEGIEKNARTGNVIVVPTSLDPSEWTLMALAGCTLLEGFYLAHQSDPENKMVEETERQGVPNVTILHPDTPDDAIRYYRDSGNSQVGRGVKRSFLEDYEATPDVEATYHINLIIYS